MKTLNKLVALYLLLLVASEIFAQGSDDALKPPSFDSISTAQKHAFRRNFHYPGKQYFFEGQVVMGGAEVGFRVVGGYRFGQFGILGLGGGIDFLSLGPAITNPVNTDVNFASGYMPLYAHYSADILKNRVTPFYSLEAGYGIRFGAENSYLTITGLGNPIYKNRGGFTGDAGFGIKLYAPHNLYATWSLNVDIKQAYDKYTNGAYNSIGEYVHVSYSASAFFFIPAIKIALGF